MARVVVPRIFTAYRTERPAGPSGVITVSEPSAKATRLVRTEQYAPAHSRSSAAHNDALRHENARPISVHTQEVIAVASGWCSKIGNPDWVV